MKPTINEAIIVEGRYDKNSLSQIVDAVIIETNGFAIFNQNEKLDLIKRLAKTVGVIILTDSDNAGLLIRNKLNGLLTGKVYHAYTEDIAGKEKRKTKASKENKIGVEGHSAEALLKALSSSTIIPEQSAPVQKKDLYELDFIGKNNSKQKRLLLLKALSLPQNLSVNAMLGVINKLYTKDRFIEIVKTL